MQRFVLFEYEAKGNQKENDARSNGQRRYRDLPIARERAAKPASQRNGQQGKNEDAERNTAQCGGIEAACLRGERPEYLQRAHRDEEQGEYFAQADHASSP